MFGYQRVHHEQPCKAKTGKPTVTKIGDEGEHEEKWTLMKISSFGFDGLDFNSFFHMMCENDGKPSNMFKH